MGNALIVSRPFLVLSLPSCPQCDELEALLAGRGVPASIFHKWNKADPEYPSLKASLSKFAGDSFTFPQVFAKGKYEGSFREASAKLGAGAYDALFEEEFSIEPSTVRRCVQAGPMVVFSLPTCPQCDVLRKALEERGLPVGDIFVKWDKAEPQYTSLRAQLVKITGRSQFFYPQTFVRGEDQGRFDDVMAKLEAGALDDFFSEAFSAVKRTPPPESSMPADAISFDEDF